jgi:glycosyltransferase involved in cell wall biosynthesis
MKKMIVSAFSIYPDHKSSEGIVNKNWIDILSKNNDLLTVLSPNKMFLNLYTKAKQKKLTSGNLPYKVFNKFYILFFNISFHNNYWIEHQKKELIKNLKNNEIVWVRILPITSLIPITRAYQKTKFPYIININDPLIIGKDNIVTTSFDEKELIRSKNTAQAWTFPSLSLANYMANLYGLDKTRCFVIPHAMMENKILYNRNDTSKKVRILYTGTFYKSAFTNKLKLAIKEFCTSKEYNSVEFTFVLSQFDNDSIKWLKDTIPNVNLKFKLDRSEVIELIKNHDCMFVVDSKNHTHLLKGKLIEAISFGIPIFAATYKNSVMDLIVLEYGGVSAYQDITSDVQKKMINLTQTILSQEFFKKFYDSRMLVLEKISEEKIYRATSDITNFAYNRFHNLKQEVSQAYLKEKYSWP